MKNKKMLIGIFLFLLIFMNIFYLPINISFEEENLSENHNEKISTISEETKEVIKEEQNENFYEKDYELIEKELNEKENEIKEEINLTEKKENVSLNESFNQKINENKRKILVKIEKKGKKEIEYEKEVNEEIEIKKEEEKISESILKVKVYSNTHFERPVRVYADLPKETEKDNIRVFWNNTNEEITEKEEFFIEYYDENKNEKIERISWLVPHLSEQYFTIIISPSLDNLSESLSIEVYSPLENETVKEPLYFNFSVNYTKIENVECNLTINENTQNFSINQNENSIKLEGILVEGENNWKIKCFDKENDTKKDEKTGKIFLWPINVSLRKTYLLGENVIFNLTTGSEETVNLTIIFPDNTTKQYLINSNNLINLSSTNFNLIGEYKAFFNFLNRSRTYSINRTYQIAKIELLVDKTKSEVNENFLFIVNITSPKEYITSVNIRFNDYDYNFSGIYPPGIRNLYKEYSYNYKSVGNYTPILEVLIGDEVFKITGERVEIINSKDEEAPHIEIISPSENEELTEKIVTFSYKVWDNVKVNNCSIEIYNASEKYRNLWDIEGKIFPSNENEKAISIKTNIENNSEINLTLQGFENRGYMWEVSCSDNSSNLRKEYSYFKVKENNTLSSTKATFLSGNEYSKEIQGIIDKINEFMEKEKSMKTEEKKIVEMLGIITELKTMKNRLVQIDQDLNFNIRYLYNESLREKKTKEMLEEINEIKKKIPKDIEVLEIKDYVKNSLSNNLEEVIRDYLNASKIKLSERDIKNLIKNNREAQKEIIISAILRKVKIGYYEDDKIEKIIFIEKDIKINNNTRFQDVIEVFPLELKLKKEDIVFLTDKKEIEEGRFVSLTSLKNNEKVIYYIKKDLTMDEVEKIDTILFTNDGSIKKGITGFIILEDVKNNLNISILLYILLFLVTLGGGYFVKERVRYIIKRDPNTEKILMLIKDTKKRIVEGDLLFAKMNYERMKEIYKELPQEEKLRVYKKIQILQGAIDRRDLLNLIKEYEKAKRENEKEKCLELYNKIKEIYKRLDKRDKEKVYERIKWILLI